ncbi:MAG TPA: hypothetical protein VK324_13780 [Tepidisphaeraceae bacterium]|nr:hypothetical protein [Tepidisphaeraceae bacterium]
MATVNFENLVPVDEAAKAIRMSRARVREISLANGLAVQWGGSEAHPRIKVDLAALKRCIAEQVVTRPPVRRQRQAPRPRPAARRRDPRDGAALHPHVKC